MGRMPITNPVASSIFSLLWPDKPFNVSEETALECLRDVSGKDVLAWIRWAKETGYLRADYPEDVKGLRNGTLT